MNNQALQGEGSTLKHRISCRTKEQYVKLRDHELFLNNQVNEKGDLVHLALSADCERVSFAQAIKEATRGTEINCEKLDMGSG